ncbi:uncharacterized protein LOC103701193 isoform X1 [Phoenix dactylifera]|uniref:Uncharacterized protein LOC103701193 isoform X1 n=1 Tax=Phoenix dactylifera TaxID=42345 RepID=A0A8B8J0Y4_PHODC|nr:uncharacterized protein LOC103701193 isoform X1 [Phoenix dactylifera]XP_026658066.2 uncharacterized protein LOC103701193 isoform X1 [Phoenix dactylifera]XP_026658067.2 uncharacterized protein LOC103701193 isoform X1 [Phoenix dactylifera]
MVEEREAEKGGEERQASSLPSGKRVLSAPSASNKKKTRDHPDLTVCHRCGLRFPSDSPRDRLLPLRSQWRVVLLCKPCLSLLRSALACSYCFEEVEQESSSSSCVDCLRCSRRVHRHCIHREQRCFVTPQHLDPASFTCIDCCAIPRSRIAALRTATTTAAHPPSVSLEDAVKNAEKKAEAAAVAKENALKKAVAAKRATERARDALGAVLVEKKGGPQKPSADSVVPDEELALQLHLAMNGSQRISRSSSRLGRGLADPKKVRGGGGGDSKPSVGRDIDLDLRICGKVEFCTEDKSLFDSLEKTGLDLGSDGQEKKKVGDRNRKHGVGDKHSNGSLSDMNDHVLPSGCGKNVTENLSELQQKKGSTPDRYLKKYSKRNSRLKGVVNRNDSQLVPFSQISG